MRTVSTRRRARGTPARPKKRRSIRAIALGWRHVWRVILKDCGGNRRRARAELEILARLHCKSRGNSQRLAIPLARMIEFCGTASVPTEPIARLVKHLRPAPASGRRA